MVSIFSGGVEKKDDEPRKFTGSAINIDFSLNFSSCLCVYVSDKGKGYF